MLTATRKTATKGRNRDGSRSPTIRQMAKKAVSALATYRALPHDSEAGVARVLMAMIRGVDVRNERGRRCMLKSSSRLLPRSWLVS